MAWHHHGSDRPTSARAVLHHTDSNGPNILMESVPKEFTLRSSTLLSSYVHTEKMVNDTKYTLNIQISMTLDLNFD